MDVNRDRKRENDEPFEYPFNAVFSYIDKCISVLKTQGKSQVPINSNAKARVNYIM